MEAMITVEEALRTRRSVRAFRDTPVPRGLVARILTTAARAPSGSNIQPWRVYATTGAAKRALSRDLMDAHAAGDPGEEEYAYYPTEWREPYLARRRKVGWDLYGALGIQRGDKDAMTRQLARNYLFFDAPVGLMFTIDRRLEVGSWLDYGMFLQSVMLAARGFGLDTCSQQAFAKYHRIIRRHLAIPDDEVLICGMALGHAEPAAVENRFDTERMPVSEFVRFTQDPDWS
ncbi:nitroreductase [Azospirillum canadense]|uniref:nitroreductase n=1 Tax=Azospirillum canadense TaxID=403962 RepID=UPI00222703B8|nr:nitroreductase [Azospirillum canadense]MCW2241372.1 nitroreductase [Azospirillum canadense]